MTAGLLVALAVIAFAPSVAGAEDCVVPSPTQDQYCPSVPPPSTTTDQGSSDPATSSGALPFTGYDAGLAALAAVALIGAGLGLRRTASDASGDV